MKRLGVALLVVLAGACGGALMPQPWSWLSFAGGAVVGLCFLLWKKRDVILRFGSLTWTREELCRHILITGDTGTGKTKSGMQPILVQLTRNVPDWGGLVLGVVWFWG